MPSDFTSRVDAWLARCPDPEHDPLPGMAEAGLLQPADSYTAIARGKAALVERTGLPGVASIWGGRQVVGCFFIEGFGDPAQRAAWYGRAMAVAISEQGVGAHPKRLTTRAEADGDGFRITGEKAWVTNGPIADAFIVLAITAEHDGRKRYSALLVPRDLAGLSLAEMPAFDALRPSRHCLLRLDGVRVPRSALLGVEGSAYEAMALPFRDVEDAVGTFTWLGAMRFLVRHLMAGADADDAVLSRGGLVALSAVFAAAAETVVAALDAGNAEMHAGTLVGLRVLAADWLERWRGHVAQHGPTIDARAKRLMTDLDALLSVARGPRLARQARLGRVSD